MCSTGVSKLFKSFFKSVPWVFQWFSKDVQKVFQGYFKGILRVFQWPINGFSRAFKSMSKLNNVTHARGGFNDI